MMEKTAFENTGSVEIKGMTGLAAVEAADRLRREGYNELPSSQRRGIGAIAWEVVQDPIFLLLLGVVSILWFEGLKGRRLPKGKPALHSNQ